ncbi:MAG TPA: hypothetical protein VHF27_01065 [Acidimicrobiales bacterium]|nr:hypothetical protein [Acidimicrobiales bacterium]
MGRRWAGALALLIGVLADWSGVAEAGGGRLAPVRDRYEPGEVATLVGYTAGPVPQEPFYAYLRSADGVTEWYVGELVVEETPHTGHLHLRVSVAFEVPAELEPGEYDVVHCDDGCTGAALGDLVASPVSIGVDPARRVVREWALDDPEVANLEADVLLVGLGFQTTAGQLRAPPPEPEPVPVPPPPPLALPAPSTTAATTEEMAWPLPTALVVAGAAGTALFLSRRQRAVTPRAAARPLTTPSAGRG